MNFAPQKCSFLDFFCHHKLYRPTYPDIMPEKNLWTLVVWDFLYAGCPLWHPINTFKAVKELFKFGRSRSNHTSVITEICQKILTYHTPPFKVTGTDINLSATYDFLLVFYSNNSPILYRFRYK